MTIPDRRQAYDKLEVIVISLNEKAESRNRLSGMLNTLLSPTLPVEEKKRKLEEEYGISMKRKQKEEVQIMCNLSEWVAELGRSEGIELGRSEGIELGRSEGIELGRSAERELIATKMLVSGSYSDDEIVMLSDISEEQLSQLKMNMR